MAYKLRIHVPADEHEAAAKFAYFRKAEAAIDVGPAAVEPVKLKPKKRMRRKPSQPRAIPECGTYSGWSRHNRDGTEIDRACMDAQSAYQRDYRATLRNMRAAA